MIWRSFWSLSLALLTMVIVAGCGGGAEAPTEAPATAMPTEAPTQTPTEVPTQAPTEAPTEVPAAAPTDTPASSSEANVKFKWSTEGNLPADSDDVDDIVRDAKGHHEGILNGYGNEIGLTIIYDPTLITEEEVAAILGDMGHPVEAAE